MHRFFFAISLLYVSTCFEHCALIIWRSKLYYTASDIITVWWYQRLYNKIWSLSGDQILFYSIWYHHSVMIPDTRSRIILCDHLQGVKFYCTGSGIITMWWYQIPEAVLNNMIIIRRSKFYYTAFDINTVWWYQIPEAV